MAAVEGKSGGLKVGSGFCQVVNEFAYEAAATTGVFRRFNSSAKDAY
jgi:hypothetical protein